MADENPPRSVPTRTKNPQPTVAIDGPELYGLLCTETPNPEETL